jgi:hypothetical protein
MLPASMPTAVTPFTLLLVESAVLAVEILWIFCIAGLFLDPNRPDRCSLPVVFVRARVFHRVCK